MHFVLNQPTDCCHFFTAAQLNIDILISGLISIFKPSDFNNKKRRELEGIKAEKYNSAFCAAYLNDEKYSLNNILRCDT